MCFTFRWYSPQLTLSGVWVSPSSDPNVCHHHRRGEIPFGRAPLSVCLSLSPALPLSHSVTLLWRMWWKWLFNHAERSTNQRARAEWFKGLFRAQLEGEGEGRATRGREGEREGDGFDCCMAQVTSHPLTTGLVSPIIVPDRLMYRQGDEWMERVEGG